MATAPGHENHGSFSVANRPMPPSAVSPTRTPLMLAPFPSPTMGASNGFCIDASSASARSSRVLCIVSRRRKSARGADAHSHASSHMIVVAWLVTVALSAALLVVSEPLLLLLAVTLFFYIWLLSGFLIIPPAVASRTQGLLHRPFAHRHHLHHRRAEAARFCCTPPMSRARRA